MADLRHPVYALARRVSTLALARVLHLSADRIVNQFMLDTWEAVNSAVHKRDSAPARLVEESHNRQLVLAFAPQLPHQRTRRFPEIFHAPNVAHERAHAPGRRVASRSALSGVAEAKRTTSRVFDGTTSRSRVRRHHVAPDVTPHIALHRGKCRKMR